MALELLLVELGIIEVRQIRGKAPERSSIGALRDEKATASPFANRRANASPFSISTWTLLSGSPLARRLPTVLTQLYAAKVRSPACGATAKASRSHSRLCTR